MAKDAPLTQEEIELIKRYQKAQVDLINIIATTRATGSITSYRKRLLASVNQELRILNDFATTWAVDTMPKAYASGSAQTFSSFRKQNVVVKEVALNVKVVNLLTKNAAGLLTDAGDFVGRTINDTVRRASIEAVSEKVATGSTVKQAKTILIEKLTDKGILTIKDKAGRMVRLDSYAAMVARTTTREATNKGAIQTVEDAGFDLVRMSEHFTACPICSKFEGRVYSISGKSEVYPPLDEAFSSGHAIIHPNCRHVLTPYFPELDDDAAKMIVESNRAFETDPRDARSLKVYHNQQEVKSKRRDDRNQWDEAKAKAPNETPKTFSAFRSMKKANSEKFQAIKEKL